MQSKTIRRQKESLLYELLMTSYFEIFGGAPIKLNIMYQLVKENYPNLCDDDFKCPRNLSQSEWQHIVLLVRKSLKNKGLVIKTENYSEWLFFPRV